MNDEKKTGSGRLEPSQVHRLETIIDYAPGAVVSRTLVQSKAGTVTLFSFDAGQGLSEHSAPYDALVQVVDGETELTIGGKPMTVKAGETVLMPADIPHAVNCVKQAKLLLTMIRG
jgi:quercetin dioxygenase-like cupin family protein